MNLTELKQKPITDLLQLAEQLGIENMARSRKQDVIFSLLKKHAKSGEEISGDGVLEILQDGFGFLRSADASYLAGPDDIYVSPNMVRQYGLRTGDTVEGEIREPRDGERYFALTKVLKVNFDDPDAVRHRVNFDNLTPLYPDSKLTLDSLDPTIKDKSARVIDIVSPQGKGQTLAMIAVHDLNLALRFCDRIVVLGEGRVLASGRPADVLTPALLRTAYGVRARVERCALGHPIVLADEAIALTDDTP